MDKKYINFYKKFILQTKTVSDSEISASSDLKGDNNGRINSNGICFWYGWSGCTRSFGKTNKDPKRKRNSRSELQGRVIHCLHPLSDRRINNDRSNKKVY